MKSNNRFFWEMFNLKAKSYERQEFYKIMQSYYLTEPQLRDIVKVMDRERRKYGQTQHQ